MLARKPLCGTVAANVLTHGTRAINVDGCRVDGGKRSPGFTDSLGVVERSGSLMGAKTPRANVDESQGRWPANVIIDEAAGAMLDEQSGYLHGPGNRPESLRTHGTEHVASTTWGGYSGGPTVVHDKGVGCRRQEIVRDGRRHEVG